MRTVIDIPEADLSLLDQFSAARHMSREELASEVVTVYLRTQPSANASQEDRDEILERTFGLWGITQKTGLRIRKECALNGTVSSPV